MNAKPIILVVEDDQTLLKTIVKTLHGARYQTLQTSNGIDALKMVDESKPDLILLDVKLPDLNGLEVCRRIKTGEQKHTFIILISGLPSDSDCQAEGLESGADGYMVRPISNRELLARINAMLRIKASEHVLCMDDERLRSIYENLPLPYQSLDETGNIIDINEAWLDTLGFTRDEVIGKWFGDFLAIEQVDHFRKRFMHFKTKGEVKAVEYEVVRKDGTHLFVTFDGHIQHDSLKHFIKTHCILTDITGQKKAVIALQQSEQMFRLLLEHAGLGVGYYDLEGNVIFFNNVALQLMGGNPEDYVDKNVIELYGKEFGTQILQRINHVAQSERTGNYEDLATLSTGTKWFLSNYARVYNASLEVTGVQIISQDVTERKRTEEALNNISIRQEAILASIPDILMEVDENKVYTWANPAGLLFFGEDVIGHKADDYFMGEQDVYNDVKSLFDGDENSVYIESWQQRHDGQRRLLAWWCRVLKDENDKVIGALSTARDITEIRLAEEEIHTLNAELEERVAQRTRELSEAQEKIVRQEKLAVLGQMAGGVGHELRNPLGVISNAVYFLKMHQPEMDAKVVQYLEMIETETRTAEKIINDLLEFARVKSVVRETVRVSDLIEFALSRRPVPLNISIKKDLPSDLPLVIVDPRQISQILENLVVNSFQAMPEGGSLNLNGKLNINNDRNYVSISVCDTGSGISKENMGKLFEPLFTTKPMGIGLGLAVCRKLIEFNEGWIEVQSEEGKGSVFTLHLPAVMLETI
jgi:PAS domain S-box-containing protein